MGGIIGMAGMVMALGPEPAWGPTPGGNCGGAGICGVADGTGIPGKLVGPTTGRVPGGLAKKAFGNDGGAGTSGGFAAP